MKGGKYIACPAPRPIYVFSKLSFEFATETWKLLTVDKSKRN